MTRCLPSLLALALICGLPVRAAELAGVTMPDSVQVSGTKLVLNGLGLRKKFVVKVYVAGLYLPQKSSDPAAILRSDTTKRIVLHFVRNVSKEQLTDAFNESFAANARDAARAAKADIDRFFGALQPVTEGEEMAFTFTPGQGTTLSVNGADKLTIVSPAFVQVLFSVWLGPKPPNADLKKGMLGQ